MSGKKQKANHQDKTAIPKQNKYDKWLKGYYPLLWIALIGFTLYGRTLLYQYTYFDDNTLVLERLGDLKKISNFPGIFTEDVFHSTVKGYYYRPLETLSFMVDAIVGSGKFSYFHFSNIFFHLVSAFLLFVLFLNMGMKREISFAASLVFLVHPVLVQDVAWIPGRNDSLCSLFVISSFIFFIKYLNTQKLSFQVWHLLLFIAALLTKETAAVLPVLAIFWMFIHKKTNKSLLGKILFLWTGIVFIWLVIRFHALGDSPGFSAIESIHAVFLNLPAVIPYLGKIFIPLKLSPYPVLEDLNFHFITGSLAILLLIYLFFKTNSQHKSLFVFGIVWFLFLLIPSLIQSTDAIPKFSEHRAYMALPGLLLCILNSDMMKNIRKMIFPVLLIVVFSVITIIYTSKFRDRLTFWKYAYETSVHNSFNCNNLGAMYYLDNNTEEAEKYFRKTVEINSSEPLANGNLGLVLMNTERPGEAEKYLLKEIQVNPNYDNVHFNIGVLYYNNGNKEKALTQFEQTIRINPGYGDAYKYIVDYYLNRKDTADATKWADEAQKYSINVFK